MHSENSITLIGHVGRDVEMRNTQGGHQMATTTLATTRRWRSEGNDNWDEKTSWHRLVGFRHQAEAMSKCAFKGAYLYIEGRLEYREWKTQGGEDRLTAEILVTKVGRLQKMSELPEHARSGAGQGHDAHGGGPRGGGPTSGGPGAGQPPAGGQAPAGGAPPGGDGWERTDPSHGGGYPESAGHSPHDQGRTDASRGAPGAESWTAPGGGTDEFADDIPF